ncbi:hypothetical protein HaLaN_05952 [Haematococcus lacustris]|uniref:Uncharacterized protein n=1 Tax=Haematococcus lacustris TaxID=44745 RepID=A0A699YM74_HAELA|nr:hypothetical protein HaLaN_05952 [Haematococcus lacustris]
MQGQCRVHVGSLQCGCGIIRKETARLMWGQCRDDAWIMLVLCMAVAECVAEDLASWYNVMWGHKGHNVMWGHKFRVEAHMIAEAAQRTLPLAMSRLHLVFYVSLFRPYEVNSGRAG